MTEDPSGLDLWYIALEDVQICAADGHRVDADDGIGGFSDRRLGNILPRTLARTEVDQTPHCSPLTVADVVW